MPTKKPQFCLLLEGKCRSLCIRTYSKAVCGTRPTSRALANTDDSILHKAAMMQDTFGLLTACLGVKTLIWP